jgi:acetate kinase
MLSTPEARTKVMVITTDEELVIAMDTVRLA